ncbi:DUF6438 domain-containing protein [Flavilitoribacter nigricans]|nr:DUF6438 domain-containing protein [Flavilitoribacter nigricans]
MRALHTITKTAGLSGMIFFFTFGMFSCKAILKDTDLNDLEKVVSMNMGPCYGNCPVYTITVYDNGIVAYEGERFTERRGVHIRDIGRSDLKALKQELVAANLFKFPNAFKSQIPDLPTVTIEYFEDGRSKVIRGKDGRPPQVLKIQELLEQIANEGEWKQQQAPATGVPEDFIAHELIVQLDREVVPEQWSRQYAQQDLRVVKRLSPNNSYWLVRYNTDAMHPNDMLRQMRQDPDVIKVEFNKSVQGRQRDR